MGLLKKLIVLWVILAIAYFAGQRLGLLQGDLDRVRELDSRFGLGIEKLAPATEEELATYEAELGKIMPTEAREKKLAELKSHLAQMQKALLSLAHNRNKIDFSDPNCGPAGAVKLAQASAKKALESAQKASELRAEVRGLQGFGYIDSTDFDKTLKNISESTGSTAKALQSLCT